MKAEQVVTQDNINAKLFDSLERLDERMDKFEAKIVAQMNWQSAIFTLIMVGVLAKVITS